MDKKKLALHGGVPEINYVLAPFRTIGEEEISAAVDVMRTGSLSAYIGAPGRGFMGGVKVRSLESEIAKYFGVKHAVALNSWTSGLIAAIGAIDIEPGDEVITTPWTMAATATAILHWNAIPVFADIDPKTFNINPLSVQKLITPKTKAILAVDIFGQSADIVNLRRIASQHGLKLIFDTAQSPGAKTLNGFAGTFGDVGGYSFNYHKHIHCGEGGVLVTNDDRIARRVCLIRNHAEAVVDVDSPTELCNMLGYNFRLGEIESAIALVQLKKLPERIMSRQTIANQLNDGLRSLKGLSIPYVAPESSHIYYVYGITLDINLLGVSRERIIEALRAEGVPSLMAGYQNLHLLPIFRNKIAYGTNGFPWSISDRTKRIIYGIGQCPIAEELHAKTFLGLNICLNEFSKNEVESVIRAFHKVWNNLNDLK